LQIFDDKIFSFASTGKSFIACTNKSIEKCGNDCCRSRPSESISQSNGETFASSSPPHRRLEGGNLGEIKCADLIKDLGSGEGIYFRLQNKITDEVEGEAVNK
jgi:hypothetical protein